MAFLDVMQTYFRGEKIEALAFILPVGLLLVAFGAVALKVERGGFAWGVAVPCFVFGLVLISIGASIGWRTANQVAEIANGFDSAPAEMVGTELPRMQQVDALFKQTYIAFAAATVVALVLIFAVRSDWARGLGAALVLIAGIGFLIDGFASRRTVPYSKALEQLAQEHPADG